MALKVGELFASFGLDTSGVDGAISSIEKKCAGIGKGMTAAGLGMTAAVTTAMTKAGKAIYSAGTSFDAQMSKVSAISGATGDEFDKLRAKALGMGATSAYTAAEAGEALQYMAMAGWKTESMLAGLEPIMNLAAAAGADLGTTSDIVTDAMTAFKIPITTENIEHFSDVLAAASSSSNTSVTLMGETFKKVAPVAGSFGYSIDDMAVSIGLMANAGIKGETAGMALRNVLTRLAKPTGDVTKAMKKYGLSLTNADGTMKPFSEIVGDMRSAFKGMTADQKAEVAATLAGQQGMAGLLAIVDATEEDFNALSEAIEGSTGATGRMKDEMLDNAAGAVTILKSAVEGLEITLWDLVKEPFKVTVQSVTDMVDSFRQMDKGMQMSILKLGGVAAAAGPVLTIAGRLLPKLPALAKGIASLSSPMGIVAIGAAAMGMAIANDNNNIGILMEQGAVKFAGSLKQMRYSMNRAVPKLHRNMGTLLGSMAKSAGQLGPEITTLLMDAVVNFTDLIGNNAPAIANVGTTLLKSIASSFKKNAPRVIPQIVEHMGSLLAASVGSLPSLIQAGGDILAGLVGAWEKIDWNYLLTNVRGQIEEGLRQTGDVLKRLILGDEYKPDASWTEVGSELWDKIWEGLTGAVTTIRDVLGTILLGDKYKATDDWATFGTKLVDALFEGFDAASDGAESVVNMVLGKLGELFSEANITAASGSLQTVISRILTATAAEIPRLGTKISGIITAIGTALFGKKGTENKGLVTNGTVALRQLLESVFKTVNTQIIPNLGSSIRGILTAITDVLTGANAGSYLEAQGTTMTTAFTDLLRAVINGMSGAVTGIIGEVGGIFTAIANAMFATDEEGNKTGLVHSLTDSAAQLAGDFITALGYGIKSAAGATASLITTIAGLFSPENLKSATDDLSAFGDSVIGALMAAIEAAASGAGGIITAIGTALFGDAENPSLIASGLTALKTLVTNLFTTVRERVIPSMKTSIGGIFTAIGNVIKNARAGEIFTSIKGFVESVLTGFSGIISQALPEVVTAVGGILDAIADVLTGKDDDGNTILRGGVDWLTGIITGIFNTLNTIVIPNALDLGKKVFEFLTKIFAPDNMEQLGGSVGDLIGAVITGITDTIENFIGLLVQFGEDGDESDMFKGLYTGITTMLSRIFTALTKAVPRLTASAGDLASALFTALGDAVAKVPSFVGEALSGGALIANNILTSIVNAVTSSESRQAAVDLGSMAATFVEKMFGTAGDLSTDTNIINFIDSIRLGLLGALENAGLAFGTFVSQLLGKLFTREGQIEIFRFGLSVMRLLGEGLIFGLSSVGAILKGFLDPILEPVFEFITNKLKDWGFLDESTSIEIDGVEVELPDVHLGTDTDAKIRRAVAAVVSNGLEGGYGDGFGNATLLDLDGIITSLDGATQEAIKASNFMTFASRLWGAIKVNLDSSSENFPAQLKELFIERFSEIGLGDIANVISDDFYEDFAAAYIAGNAGKLRELMERMLLESVSGPDTQAAAEEAAAAESDALNTALENFASDTGATDATDNIITAMEGASAAGVAGMTGALVNGQEPVKEAALQVSDTAVKAFMLNMSSENGASIGAAFIDGLVSGITEGVIRVTAAARSVATAAAGAIRETLQIHSPSKITDYYGEMIDEGLAKGMNETIGPVVDAANSVVNAVTDTMGSGNWGTGETGGLDLIMPDFKLLRDYGIGQALAEDAAEELRDKPRTRGGSRNSTTTNNRTYNDTSSFNVQTVKVQGMDDIKALAAEITAARRRMAYGYGS